jgi:hypothetical protein
LQVKYIDQPGRPIEVQILVAPEETHAGYQPDEPEIVVPVQVGDENMINAASPDFVLVHLRLGALPAIYQEKMVVEGDHLGRRVPVKSRDGRIISKYGYREHREDLGMIDRAGDISFMISAEK